MHQLFSRNDRPLANNPLDIQLLYQSIASEL